MCTRNNISHFDPAISLVSDIYIYILYIYIYYIYILYIYIYTQCYSCIIEYMHVLKNMDFFIMTEPAVAKF